MDHALKTTFRNYATLFFVVAALTVPVHVLHSFVYRDVVAVREIHEAVEELEPGQQVRRVSSDDLDRYRMTGWLIAAVEVALIPVLAGAVRMVLAARDAISVPAAWSHAVAGWRADLPRLAHPIGAIAGGAVVALTVGVMLRATGLLLSEPVGEAVSFGPVGLTEGIARAAAAPFLLVPLARAAGKTKGIA